MAHTYRVEFFVEDDGSSPVVRWITEELSPAERRAVTAAMSELVAEMGQDICATDFGKGTHPEEEAGEGALSRGL